MIEWINEYPKAYITLVLCLSKNQILSDTDINDM